MLRKLVIENYKSIRTPIEIEFRPLTFLYGPNSIGKSTVLDAIDLVNALINKDPNLPELVAAGRRDIYKEIADECTDIGIDEFITLRLSASVDSAMLNQDGLALNDLPGGPALYTKFIEGAEIGLTVVFDGPRHPTELLLEIDGEEVLSYTHKRTYYDPYFRPRVTPVYVDGMIISPFLEGECRIRRKDVDSLRLSGVAVATESRRKKLLFEEHGEWLIIRGLQYTIPSSKDLVTVSEDTMEMIFPTLGAADFIERRSIDLDRYALEQRYSDIQFLKTELAKEFTPAFSSEVFADLRLTSRSISDYYAGLFKVLSTQISFYRVRGDRSSVRSDRPLHLRSMLDYLSETKSNLRLSPIYNDLRKLDSGNNCSDRRNDQLLAEYARELYTPSDNNFDFPNFALKNYMPSLRRYEFRREVYELIDRDLLSSAENLNDIELQKLHDPYRLSASYLVYFSVGESPIGSRTFAQVGSSLGYLLPILVVLAQERSCGLEEPELHLHPTAQEELADVFLHARKLGRVIVIESHSECFLLKISRRMKETYERGENGNVHLMPAQQRLAVKPDEIGIYVFSSDQRRGVEARSIKMLADGSLEDDWPKDLFDTSWASVLGRLTMFSKQINIEEVTRDWPWISEVEENDYEIAQWLTKCWQLRKLGNDFVENELVTIGRIAEKALFVRLLEGLADLPRDTKVTVDPKWQQALDRWVEGKKDVPSLWWWKETLIYLRRTVTANEHRLLTAIRARIADSTWRSGWQNAQSLSLISGVDTLWRLRNPAAHGTRVNFTSEEVELVRALVYQRSRAGLLLTALGFTRVHRGGKPRPLFKDDGY